MKVLGAASIHKSKSDGVRQQLRAVARYTGWPDPFSDRYPSAIRELIRAPIHDAVDAYTCAWIAALGPEDRIPLGSPQTMSFGSRNLGVPGSLFEES